MSHAITFIWIALGLLMLFAGLRWLWNRHGRRRGAVVDDEAIAHILANGTLVTDDDEPLDEAEIARAEEEFWEQSWDEPDEYSR